MEKLLATQHTILTQFKKRPYIKRSCYAQFRLGNLVNGIIGQRGVGKTTFLLKTALEQGAARGRALYVSADDLYFLDNKLIDLVDELYKLTDIRLLCIDEIHKYSNWNHELKNIADVYPSIKILFSGSSMIDLIDSKYDLSRRVTLYPLHGLSFREYLQFDRQLEFPVVTTEDLLQNHQEIASQLSLAGILKYFNRYLSIGYYPFFTYLAGEYEIFQAIENIIQKTIYEDIATLHRVKSQSLATIEKIFKYIVNSTPGELNANKLASILGTSFDTVSLFLDFLHKSGLVRFLHNKGTGKKSLKNPTKIYPDNTNCMHAYYLTKSDINMLGKLRETFLINQLQNTNHQVYYSNIGDFQVDDFYIEVGGKNKTGKQLKNSSNGFIAADNIEIGFNRKIPLYLFGFLY